MMTKHLMTIILLIIAASSMAFSHVDANSVGINQPKPSTTGDLVRPTLVTTDLAAPSQATPTETPAPIDEPTETPVATEAPTETAIPTETQSAPTTAAAEETTPAVTTAPVQGALRPIVVVLSYKTKPSPVTVGQNFVLDINIENQGQISARNLLITFTPGDFLPRDTGGVLAVSQLEPDEDKSVKQSFVVTSALQGQNVATLAASINYLDESGNAYAESFTFAIGIEKPVYSGGTGATTTPTPTATQVTRPQLVIGGYTTDSPQLIPGGQFNLELTVINAGNADAKRVSMIVGGAATAPTTDDSSGTPMPPGYSATGGEFTNFSPLGVSNVQYLGDLPRGGNLTGRQPLIVNVSTNPGVYSLKISFAYNDEKGNLLIDDQVISLLVFSPPVVEMNFYRDTGPLFAGQPNMLPLQIVNLGRKSVVLGNMKVNAQNVLLENNTTFIGPLEAGNYFTLDANFIPNAPGPVELELSVDFTDDFNQAQTITQTISVEVLEAPPPMEEPGTGPGTDPGMGGLPPDQQETFWQKALRFVKGLIGLDSGTPVMVEGPAGGPMEGPIDGPGGVEGGPPLQ
ncbi:MAG TPA: hypothetical protein VIK64_06780 [Anaerolineales bacterium]